MCVTGRVAFPMSYIPYNMVKWLNTVITIIPGLHGKTFIPISNCCQWSRKRWRVVGHRKWYCFGDVKTSRKWRKSTDQKIGQKRWKRTRSIIVGSLISCTNHGDMRSAWYEVARQMISDKQCFQTRRLFCCYVVLGRDISTKYKRSFFFWVSVCAT